MAAAIISISVATSRVVAGRRAEDEARQPWRTLYRSEGVDRLVHAATLASNAHNTQPWRFIADEDRISVFAALERNIGSFDPMRREMFLSLGCAIENLILQGAADGVAVDLDVAPTRLPPMDDREPIATLRLRPAPPSSSDLAAAIPYRRAHRGPYDRDRPVPQPVIGQLNDIAAEFSNLELFLFAGVERDVLARQIIASTRDILADREMAADNAAGIASPPMRCAPSAMG